MFLVANSFGEPIYWLTTLVVAIHLAIQLALAVRIVMQRRAVGESLAWIMVVFIFPVVGPLVYLMVGELRLGRRRARRFVELFPPIQRWLEELPRRRRVDWQRHELHGEPLSRLAERSLGLPALPDNALELLDDWQAVFRRLIVDIDNAQRTCHMEFYIWQMGGAADDVAEALLRARGRGVVCRLLVDALGSRPFLRGETAVRLREAGVEIQAALPGGLLRMPFVRFDIRLHRKIVVIDGMFAYTGSLNLVDPRYFKRDAGVGPWVDAMVRLQGPAVEGLAITFLADWYVETDAQLDDLRQTGDAHPQPVRGESAVQVLPSGPAFNSEAIEQVLVMAAYSARRELVLTTPYFVPNEVLRIALISAARRGVKVLLVVPAKIDSLLVRHASQAFRSELLDAGVRIAQFDDGLLHTKSVTVDGEISLFGSVNLDPRSFRLNFEISLAVYDRTFTGQLRNLQQQYIDRSELMDLAAWNARPTRQRATENFARLFSPLL